MINDTIKELIWRFTLVLTKINYGQNGDQTGLFYTTNPVFYTGQSVRWNGNQCFSGPNWFLPDLSLGPACLGISDIWMVVLSNYFYSLHFVEINSSMFQLYVCKVYFVFHFRFMEKKVCCKFFSSIYLKQFIIYILAWCHTLYPKWLVTNKNMDI